MNKKTILVTGGAGFIGREIVRQLLKKNYTVIVIDNLSKNSDYNPPQGVQFVNADLRDRAEIEKYFKGVHSCIHLAARIGGIGYLHKIPADIIADNNLIFDTIFRSSVKHNLKRVVYISSSMIYESVDVFPIKENTVHTMALPVTAYGFSKIIGEWYCKAFYEQHGLEYTIIRPFNVYGINELPKKDAGHAHVIPDLIKKVLSNKYPIQLFGDGKQKRCFTHVSDLARGVILAMESKSAVNEDFNLGTVEEVSISELLTKIHSLSQTNHKLDIEYVPGFEHDVKRRQPAIDKAKKMLNWQPEKQFDEGLKEVIEWLKKSM